MLLFDALPSTSKLNTKSELSTSLPERPINNEKSSSISWSEIKSKIGESLTAVTVKLKSCTLENSPSKAVMDIKTSPDQSWSGVIVKVLPINSKVTLPEFSEVNTRNGPSTSSTSKSITKGVSSWVDWSIIEAKSIGSFIGRTVKTNISELINSPSDTEISTSISPLKFKFGLISKILLLTLIDAKSELEAEKNKSSPSTSSANKVIEKFVSSLTLWFSKDINTGASFTAFTLIVTIPTPDVHVPSVTVKPKESEPLKSALGA